MDILSSLEVQLIPYLAKAITVAISALSTLLIFSGDCNFPKDISSVTNGQCFDVIIVGAGSAGCVVANRLSEVENLNVLLIEAGDNPQVDALIPGLFPFAFNSEQDWKYYSEDDGYTAQSHKNRSQHYNIGKMLGGSSGTNLMFYVRGHKQDYANWVEAGATGWDWETVLYYFKKSERLISEPILNGFTAYLHNDNGYLGVSRPDWGEQSNQYLEAFKENGHRILEDNNDINPLGYSQPSFTIDPPYRQNTALAFLKPVKGQKNLFVLKNSYVRKVIFDENNRATGVEVNVHGKEVIQLYARKEVILSAGALNTPRILMSSGVGPKEHLEEKGVQVVLNSPNVGKNLQDHPTVVLSLTGKRDILSAIDNVEILNNLDKFPTPIIMGFSSLDKSNLSEFIDYEVVAFPFHSATPLSTLISSYMVHYDDYISEAIAHAGQTRLTLFTALSLLHPESRGSVQLRSSNPEDAPVIDSGFYKVEADLDKHARCVEDYVSVINTTYFKSVDGSVVDYGIKQCKHLIFNSHEYWKCHIKNMVQTEWHLTGTCAMGPEGVGVTDERLRVRGIEGLRVVDGGAIPLVTSGNTNAPIIMLAERASDLIKGDNGWPVQKEDFH